jgi:hypothetical protein
MHKHYPVPGFEENVQIHLGLTLEGDFKELSAQEQHQYRTDLQDDLLDALGAYVVYVECRRLRAGSIIADCVATLKVGATGEGVVQAVQDQMDLVDSKLRQGERSRHIIAVADPIQIYPLPSGHEEQYEEVAVPIIPPQGVSIPSNWILYSTVHKETCKMSEEEGHVKTRKVSREEATLMSLDLQDPSRRPIPSNWILYSTAHKETCKMSEEEGHVKTRKVSREEATLMSLDLQDPSVTSEIRRQGYVHARQSMIAPSTSRPKGSFEIENTLFNVSVRTTRIQANARSLDPVPRDEVIAKPFGSFEFKRLRTPLGVARHPSSLGGWV